ncbi:CheR family methyltransferase [Verrucomicrobium spinosum]|uniref:CheR family methyltransferase n=1 Tax=Verrucomicrobium spinosum TaxID=2736 RepID=UPI00017443D1|nr:CheR family methyltransferase [Verrucomicrobium spinosum]
MSAAEPMADPGVSGLLSDPEFQKLKEWIISTTGLSYYADKDRDLATAVGRCQELGGRPAREVLEVLNRRGGPALDRLVEELTIGETFFFRHLEMFHALRDHVLPDLIQRRAALRSIRIWSAGCSVGAEPYSLSILLHDLLGDAARNWSFKIVATDINRRFLALARAGVYDTWALRGMDPALLQRTFHRVGARWRINDLYREAVTFRHHNLVQDKFPSIEHELSGLDLIICRNVIIYFDTATNRRLADQFYRSLVPGGWLAVGHAEPHTEIFRAFQTINAPGAVLYQRAADGKGGGIFSPNAVPGTARTSAKLSPPADAQVQAMPKKAEVPNWLPAAAQSRPAAPEPVLQPKPVLEGLPEIQEISKAADSGDLVAARKLAEGLAAAQPLHEGAHFQLGLVLFQLGEWVKARQALKRSLYLRRDLAVAHYYLGLVQLGLGEFAGRSFQNARRLISRQDGVTVLPWGDGLTAGELRALLQPYHGGTSTHEA